VTNHPPPSTDPDATPAPSGEPSADASTAAQSPAEAERGSQLVPPGGVRTPVVTAPGSTDVPAFDTGAQGSFDTGAQGSFDAGAQRSSRAAASSSESEGMGEPTQAIEAFTGPEGQGLEAGAGPGGDDATDGGGEEIDSSLEVAGTDREVRDGVGGDGDADSWSYHEGPPSGEVRFPVASPITQSRVGGLLGLLSGLVILRPWLWSGEILVRDLAAISDPVINVEALARGAGPSWDLLGQSMALLVGQVVGMDLLVRVMLVGSFIALGAGAGRLAGTNGSRVAAAVAAVAVTWNPFVWSRLDQGDWLTVVAFAALPWVVIHLRADHRWRLARATAFAGIAGGPGWLVVLPTLLVVAIVARRLRAAVPALLVLAATAIPALIAAGRFAADPAGFEAMAATADLPSGVVTSVLTSGGYWNAAVAPSSRGSWLVALVAIVVAVVSIYGAGRWRDSPRLLHDWRTRSGLALAAIVGVVGVLFMASVAGQSIVGGLASVAPWLVAVRDSTNLLAPWVLMLAVGLGHLTWRVVVWLGDGVLKDAAPGVRGLTGYGVALAGIILVVALMPDARGTDPLPETGEVPASWLLAARMINDDPDGGTVLQVPGTRHQDFDMAPVEARSPLQELVATDVFVDSRWQVVRNGTIVVVDDDPPVAADPVQPSSAPTATLGPSEPTVVIGPATPDDVEAAPVPTTNGPTPGVVRTLESAWPDRLDGRELAELGIEWVAIVQPDAFAEPGDGLVQELIAPEIQLLRVDPEQFLIAEQPRALWPLLVDGLVATLVLALLVSAGPLRTGRERDPV